MFKTILFISLSIFQIPFTQSLSAYENGYSQVNQENRLQDLLRTHGLLLNQLIEAVSDNRSSREINEIKQNLKNNGRDLSDVFSSALGNKAGREFENLFNEHIKIGGEYIEATKKQKPTQKIAERAIENGTKIANLFSKWFPSIPNSEWKNMLREHVKMEAAQVEAYMNNDREKGLEIKEQSLFQLEQLGNLLRQGLQDAKSHPNT